MASNTILHCKVECVNGSKMLKQHRALKAVDGSIIQYDEENTYFQ